MIDWQPLGAAFLFVDEVQVRTLQKFYFRNTETKKYYVVGAYDIDHAHQLLENIDESIKSALVVVAEEDIPET